MGFISKIKDGFNAIGQEMARQQHEKARRAQEEDRQQQEILNEYRARGIYVLAVYVDGTLWNYFHYPSEDHRLEGAKEFWPRFFSAQEVPWRCEFVDPR